MKEFEGKVALITGGGNGIGLATARLFAERGARVAIADVNREAGEQAAELLRQSGAEVMFVYGDVSDKAVVEQMVAETVAKLGGLDYAANNAGITHPKDAEWDDDAFQRTLDINLSGVMHCLKAELRHMLAAGKGSIVNTASIGGLIASVVPSLPAYTASKHGVIGLTKVAALRHARDGIRVNAVLPGVTFTNMVKDVMELGEEERKVLENMAPMGRVARPEEIAEAIIWLCSDKASFVTGHSLVVDGGAIAQ
ncbi:SDR family NAD(P)-dependent oxidoreductase [Sphingobium lactosutens]|uniref:SDR family NAD(P)-dependent oxidoreductase n=1 Tax=Sphingobium lactosutens TaxID=522773 RepID=UPI002118E419|nr:glucose 1-dehydrogenase [Sphingobium lactosutens]